MAGERRRVTDEELAWQAKNITDQIKATAPEGVGFAVLFFFQEKGVGDTPVAFGHNAITTKQRSELAAILRDFANRQGLVITMN
jgi:hypothetical protein